MHLLLFKAGSTNDFHFLLNYMVVLVFLENGFI